MTVSKASVYWLTISLALVIVPHIPHVPLWITALSLVLMLSRVLLTRNNSRMPRKSLLILLAMLSSLGVLSDYGTVFGRDAGIALLIVMVELKLLEMQSLRDSMVVIFLIYFLVVTNFLYSQSLFTALYMIFAILVITATIISLNHSSEEGVNWQKLRLAMILIGQAIPMMLLLFVLFPRTPGPLWGLPYNTHSGFTGLGESMSPGSISQLSRSTGVAFRVSFESTPPNESQRYWRGPIFSYFDGRTWSSNEPGDVRAGQVIFYGMPVRYTITLEPHNKPWLLALDLPASLPPGSRMTEGLQLFSKTPVVERMRYSVTSYVQYSAQKKLSERERLDMLQLPPNSNPHATTLAQTWRNTTQEPSLIVQQALNLFRTANFIYTLEPPLLGNDFIDQFLFETKQGFCEHFAGSFVFLMRAAGIPARVVTGYLGGEVNPVGKYMIVHQSDAHAWAEVWLSERGWVRIDPTAAVAPQRVDIGITAAVPANDRSPALIRQEAPWLKEARLHWDTLNNGWNQWVLSYGAERQALFLSRFGAGKFSWWHMLASLFVGLGILLLIIALVMRLVTRYRPRDPALIWYNFFCDKLAKRGLNRRPSEGPLDYANRIARHRPDLALTVQRISKLYVALRYGRKTEITTSDIREFREMVRAFRA